MESRADAPHTRRRSQRRLRRAPHGGRDLRALPRGLSAGERAWILARAAQAGGVTAAFRHLVRLGILHDAVVATWLAEARLLRQARRAGLSAAASDERLQAWARSRVAPALATRLLNLMGWRRPGMPGGYGQAPEDDPAEPLPRATVRRLIVEGRPVFRTWPVSPAASADERKGSRTAAPRE